MKADVCDHDGSAAPSTLEPKVMWSPAGFYIGTLCDRCGPFDRKSGYFKKRADAEFYLRNEMTA